MVQRSKGMRSKTRHVLKVKSRERGRVNINHLLAEYEGGEKVIIKPNPRLLNTIPHRRTFGKVGEVVKMRGKSVEVKLKVGKILKTLILSPAHIRKI